MWVWRSHCHTAFQNENLFFVFVISWVVVKLLKGALRRSICCLLNVQTVMSYREALELAVPWTGCALNTPVLIPASCKPPCDSTACMSLVMSPNPREKQRCLNLYQNLEFEIAMSSVCMPELQLLGTQPCHLGTWGKKTVRNLDSLLCFDKYWVLKIKPPEVYMQC